MRQALSATRSAISTRSNPPPICRFRTIQGEADAKATEIYAKAYAQKPEATDFYKFLKSMDTYRKVIDSDTTLVLSTNSELFGLLKKVEQKNH